MTIEGNCQPPATEPTCDDPIVEGSVELTDKLYIAAWSVLLAATESLQAASIAEPCTKWIELGRVSITSVGDCACDALVVHVRDRRRSPTDLDGRGEIWRRPLTLDLILSHQAPLAVDGNGQPMTMPYTGPDDGSNCATLNGLSYRMLRETEAFDRSLEARVCCRVAWCNSVVTTNDVWSADGPCRRYTRTIEMRP